MIEVAQDQFTILNVNDEDGSRYIGTHVLEVHGYTVLEARSGAQALEIVRDSRPSLVVLDVRLPDVSGFDVCARVKKQDPFMAVLMVSAYFTSDDDCIKALRSGADAYLMLPASPYRLVAVAQTLLRLHTLYRRQRAGDHERFLQLQARLELVESINRQLYEKLEILQELNELMVGRELRMTELKIQVQELQSELRWYKERDR